MLLKNYYNSMFSIISGFTISRGLKKPDGTVHNSASPNIDGEVKNGVLMAFRDLAGVGTTISSRRMVFGSGNAPASVDDYKLESLITTLSGTAPSISVDSDGNLVIVANVNNTGSGAVVIREVGIASACNIVAGSLSSCLIERTVLDEPITLAPGGTCFVSYKVKYAPTVGAFPT